MRRLGCRQIRKSTASSSDAEKPQKLIVMSTDDDKVLADLPIGANVDATKIDNGQAFASCGDGTLTVAGERSPGNFAIMQTVKTRQSARTMGMDPHNPQDLSTYRGI